MTAPMIRAVIAAACALVACASTPSSPSSSRPTPEFVFPLVVDNQGFYDATVYMVLSPEGVPRRLGIVTGNGTARYALMGPMIRPGYAIAFYAKTVEEGQEYRSGALVIFAGSGMRWTLLPKGADILVPLAQSAQSAATH